MDKTIPQSLLMMLYKVVYKRKIYFRNNNRLGRYAKNDENVRIFVFFIVLL